MRTRPITTAGVLALGLGVLGTVPASAATTTTVTTTADTTTCTSDCSLRGAVVAANAAGGGTITLAAGATYVLALPGADEDAGLTGDLDITSPVILVGNGATIDGGGLDRVLDVRSGGSLTATGLTVTGGDTGPATDGIATASGAGVRSVGPVTLTDSVVRGNDAVGTGASGGGLYNDGGTLRLVRTTVEANTAVRAGGGVEVSTGDTTLEATTLSGNTAGPTPGNGGGLHVTGAATTTVTGSTVVGNTAASEGGGLWNSATGTLTVTATRVLDNTANAATALGTPTQGGGGIFSDGGRTTVRFSQVSDNDALGELSSGGGIQSFGPLVVEASLVTGNSAVRAGGGVEANGSDTTLRFVALTGNRTGPTPGNGGAFHLTGAGTTLVDAIVGFGNTATNEGGVLWNSSAGTMTVTGAFLVGNTAPEGPSAYNDGGTLTFNGQVVPGGAGV